MKSEASQPFEDLKIPYAFGVVWFAIAAILTSHFRFYYGVDWHDALKWGAGDGFLWCVLIALGGFGYRRYFFKLSLPWRDALFIGLAVIGGVILHPILVVLFYWPIDGSISRPFIQDVAYLVMKRLPQGILAGFVIAFISISFARARALTSKSAAKPSHQQEVLSWLWLKGADGVHRVDICDIHYVEAAGNYVSIVSKDGAFLERATMKTMLAKLKGKGFWRISRKHIVNLDHVRSVTSQQPKGGQVIVEGDVSLPVSRQYKSEFQDIVASHSGIMRP